MKPMRKRNAGGLQVCSGLWSTFSQSWCYDVVRRTRPPERIAFIKARLRGYLRTTGFIAPHYELTQTELTELAALVGLVHEHHIRKMVLSGPECPGEQEKR